MSFNNYKLRIMNKISHQLLWNRYAKLSAKLLQETYLILSFDCDTDHDIEVAWEVHARLLDIGVKPVYAVPGALLERGAAVYERIRNTGAEFINHGGREHTYFDAQLQRHASCFFYDQQTQSDIYNDVEAGHKILKNVLGVDAKGWRTPHFGTYQHRDHFKFLYSILEQLSYKFSTSTCPVHAYTHGPSFVQGSLIEIPVTGMFNEPFNIMDTWGFFAAPDRTKQPQDYLNTAQELHAFATQKPLLINIYGDPSHIHDQPEFFNAIYNLSKIAKNIDYTDYLGIINDNVCNFK